MVLIEPLPASTDRRREAMGLGVYYGSLSAYDLNFSRFGVGEGTLGAVASGVYDVTSPEYLGFCLRALRATGTRLKRQSISYETSRRFFRAFRMRWSARSPEAII